MARRILEVCTNASYQSVFKLTSSRLFIKGARILDLEKLREVVGDYQHLNYAKGTYVVNLLGP